MYYGRVLDVFYVEFIEDLEQNRQQPYLLVRIQECVTRGLDATLPESPVVKYSPMLTSDIINIGSVVAAVGRVPVNYNTWAIVDRGRNSARANFADEEGDEFD
ncbi:hypothetical protein BDV93DRAFT_560760 [Ceratobasidium sp. AG-I]|nr:hypothetical protein BDV93DRAFT_560760 [Ceratobasidium sp. AG-I]